MIKLYDDCLKKDWVSYIDNNPKSSLWHHYNWLKINKEIFSLKNISLLHYQDGKINGILPLYIVNNVFYQRFAISSPFSNYSGLITNNDLISAKLINKAVDETKNYKCNYLEIRSKSVISEMKQSSTFCNMILDISETIDKIWSIKVKSKTRNQTRKAYKNNLKVKIGNNIDDINEFYKVYLQNITRLGTPVFPKKYFSLMTDLFRNKLNIISIKHSDVTIASLISINFNKTCYIPYASSFVKWNSLCPNNILYWEAIKYAKENNMTMFDFGRSTKSTGTYNFKKQWGATPLQLHYNYKLIKNSTIPSTGAINNKYKLMMKLWSKLPLTLSERLSNIIINRLPEL